MQIRTQRRFNLGMEKDMPVSSSRACLQTHHGPAPLLDPALSESRVRATLQTRPSPPLSVLWGNVFFYLRVPFIAFDHEIEKLMTQGIQQERGFQITQAVPAIDTGCFCLPQTPGKPH